jgi:hypothetical protein
MRKNEHDQCVDADAQNPGHRGTVDTEELD